MIWILLIILISAVIFSSINEQNKQNENKKVLLNNQNKILNYLKENKLEQSPKFILNDYSNGIVYDELNDELIFIKKKFSKENGENEYSFDHVKTDKIISSEILVDHQTIINAHRGSQITGALVGVTLAGVIGGAVGALSGKKIQNEKIKKIDLKVKVDDLKNPVYIINFLSPYNFVTKQKINDGYSKDSSEVKVAITNIDKWQAILESLIRKQNKVISS